MVTRFALGKELNDILLIQVKLLHQPITEEEGVRCNEEGGCLTEPLDREDIVVPIVDLFEAVHHQLLAAVGEALHMCRKLVGSKGTDQRTPLESALRIHLFGFILSPRLELGFDEFEQGEVDVFLILHRPPGVAEGNPAMGDVV
eukprot:151667_1